MLDRLILQRLPDLRATLESSGLRVISFCQLYPERFTLEYLPGWGVRVRLEAAAERLVAVEQLAEVEAALETALMAAAERYHGLYMATQAAPAAPLAWLVKRVGNQIDALVVQAHRLPLHFHVNPAASGFADGDTAAALRACVASHLYEFVAARPAVLRWVDGEPSTAAASREPATHSGGAACRCNGRIGLSAQHATRFVAAKRAKANVDAAKSAAKREARRERHEQQARETVAVAGSSPAHQERVACAGDGDASWRECELLPPSELLDACARGGTLVLSRAPARTAALFAEELRAAARHCALPTALLRPLGPGLWLVRPAPVATDGEAPTAAADAVTDGEAPTAAADAATSSADAADATADAAAAAAAAAATARAALLRLLPRLGGVRLVASLLAAADDAPSLAAATAAAVASWGPSGRGRRPFWSLEVESLFPSPDAQTLPWAPLPGLAPLVIGLSTALGATHHVTARGRVDADDFLLLVTRHCLLLCSEAPPAPRVAHGDEAAEAEPALVAVHDAPRTCECNGTGGCAAAAASTDAAIAIATTDGARVAAWVRAWEARPFTFSAALDPLVATAAVNLAIFEHLDSGVCCDGGVGGVGGVGAAAAAASALSASALHELCVYDPCCGSGTVLAAARACGVAAVGSDVRPKFVEGCAANLAHAGMGATGASGGVALFVHDATAPLTAANADADADADACSEGGGVECGADGGESNVAGADADADADAARGAAAMATRAPLLVTNPPWGKNFIASRTDASSGGSVAIASEADGTPIVRALVARHPRATMCFIVSVHAVRALRDVPGLRVRRSVRLGGVEVVVCRCVE